MPLCPLVWFCAVYTTYVGLWHVCVCFCLCLCVCVEGPVHSMRPPAAGAAGGSHSPQSDSPTGIVRTSVAGVLVVKRNSTKCKERKKTAAFIDVSFVTQWEEDIRWGCSGHYSWVKGWKESMLPQTGYTSTHIFFCFLFLIASSATNCHSIGGSIGLLLN